jgi:antitoxin HicB
MSARKAAIVRKPAPRKKGGVGSKFDDFLKEEGIYDETQALATKRVLVWQLEQEMKKQSISKQKMAARMHTSRSQLDRLLDPDNAQVQLDTLDRAARAVGRTLKVKLG